MSDAKEYKGYTIHAPVKHKSCWGVRWFCEVVSLTTNMTCNWLCGYGETEEEALEEASRKIDSLNPLLKPL